MKVSQSPQPSTTTSGTVAAWPGACCCTWSTYSSVPGAGVMVNPPGPLWLPASTVAPVAAPNRSACSPLFGVPTRVRA